MADVTYYNQADYNSVVEGDPNWKPSKGTPALLLTEHADEVYNK